jgi:hypothetical protein
LNFELRGRVELLGLLKPRELLRRLVRLVRLRLLLVRRLLVRLLLVRRLRLRLLLLLLVRLLVRLLLVRLRRLRLRLLMKQLINIARRLSTGSRMHQLLDTPGLRVSGGCGMWGVHYQWERPRSWPACCGAARPHILLI